ncbi:flavin reductase family protein [Nocardia pseudobrasiliensis]|uniref:Flavin reductase (DIM6/NTAB) family NADH-FMN oxidoreductase RutF n=1 Tax=Nocardia pseudobrasiliensis TaxID=45979 RepID=A0A370I9E7_9NOCA|nr:flavin reductase family protein [Nocardia pseudobrasiliensis]RDI67250.1 flavin reductase (DIM6/NTAB) family NADH-FMN oxidoreductase RutF [Nocardia pseudobrasiliensis]
MTTVDATVFTAAMSRIPGPVAIATTLGSAGEPFGFTGSAVSSLSLDPPMMLICLSKSASTHTAFTGAKTFMINVLAAEQADVALRFAKSGVDRFAAGDMRPCEFGLPGLPEAAARLVCDLVDVLDGGDHSILTGSVRAAHVTERIPLVYWDRSFHLPTPALVS